MTDGLANWIRVRPVAYRLAKRLHPLYRAVRRLRIRVRQSLHLCTGGGLFPQLPDRVQTAQGWIAGARCLHEAVSSIFPDVPAPLGSAMDSHPAFSLARIDPSGEGRVYRIENCRVVGAAGAVVTADRTLLSDLSPDIGFRPDEHSIFLQRRGRLRSYDGTLAILTGPSPANLSHWLYGVVPRIALLQELPGGLNSADALLLPALTEDFQHHTIDAFAVERARILTATDHETWAARRALVPSFIDTSHVLTPWALAAIRKTLGGDVGGSDDASAQRRIYIERKSGIGRVVLNNDEVWAALRNHGFEAIDPRTLSYREQIALFAAAAIVVGAHGAAMSNIVFCPPGATAIELFSESYVNTMYSRVAAVAGLRYRAVIARTPGWTVGGTEHFVRAPIVADVTQVLAALPAHAAAQHVG